MAWGCIVLVAIIILGSPLLLLLRLLTEPSPTNGLAWGVVTLLSLGFLFLLRHYKRIIEARMVRRD